MKKLIVVVLGLFLLQQANAQFNIGILGGLSSYNLPGNIIHVNNGTDSLDLSVDKARYGYHFGIFLRGQVHKFYIQPEFIFNSNRVDYKLNDFSLDTNSISGIRNERYQYLDVPIMLGLKFNFFRINAGPVGHIFINSRSELTDINGYDQKFKQMTLGWQGGIGFDISWLTLDLRYEGNFNKFGDHIHIGNNSFAFANTPSRFIASLGICF